VSRARILHFLLSHAGRTFYQREIMYETGLSLHPAQRELKNLYDLGIIKRRETLNKVYMKSIHFLLFSNLSVRSVDLRKNRNDIGVAA